MSSHSVPGTLLRHRPFLLLVAARTISVLGNGFARVALAFAVIGLPDSSPGQLSLVLACQALPQLAFVLVGGVIADRMSRSRLMVLADILGAAAYTALAVLALTGDAPLPALCFFAVLAGCATALFSPAMDGVIPLVVPRDHLQRANGLLRMSTNSSMVLGVALSGVTVAFLGAGWALALNAGSFLLSAVLVGALRVPGRPARTATGWTDLREGWREFTSHQWLWAVVSQFTVVVAALNATVGVLGPLVAEEELGGARAWSVIVGAQALGTIAGAGIAARVRVRRPILVAVLSVFPLAVPIGLLAVPAPLWSIVVAMFAAGVAIDVFGVLWATTIQREIPEEKLSRVSSYDWFGSLAFAPLGLLVAGPAAAAVGTSSALAVCAGLIVLATATPLLSPQVRHLRAPETGRRRTEGPDVPPQKGRHASSATEGADPG